MHRDVNVKNEVYKVEAKGNALFIHNGIQGVTCFHKNTLEVVEDCNTLAICKEKLSQEFIKESKKKLILWGTVYDCTSHTKRKIELDPVDFGFETTGELSAYLSSFVSSGATNSAYIVGQETMLNETWNGKQVYARVYEWIEGDNIILSGAGNFPEDLDAIFDSEYSFDNSGSSIFGCKPQHYFQTTPTANQPIQLRVYMQDAGTGGVQIPDLSENRLILKYTKHTN